MLFRKTVAVYCENNTEAKTFGWLQVGLGTRVTVGVTLRLEDYRQSGRLGAKPFEDHNQKFLSAPESLRF
jgi:hypothetical protein